MTGSAGGGASMPADERRRYLAHRQVAIAPRDRPVIAGILRADTLADLAPDAQVNALLPHDAGLVLERTDPDVVLVESGAVTSGHPWSGAGEPSVADAAGRLRRVLDVARGLGRPTVLWWSGPRHQAPGLLPFEKHFDVVLAADSGSDGRSPTVWSPGVQLTRFHPIGAPADRSMRPVVHGPWDLPPQPGTAAFTRQALAALAVDELELWLDADATSGTAWPAAVLGGRIPRRVTARDLPDRYRAQGLFLVSPLTAPPGDTGLAVSTLRQLASGARVVSGPNETLRAALGDAIAWAADADAVRDVVRATAQAGPPTPFEVRRLLRALFGTHDTITALTSLARLIGLSSSVARRDVCAVAVLDARARPADFLDAVVRQRHRPTEVLLIAADPADADMCAAGTRPAGHPGPGDPGRPGALDPCRGRARDGRLALDLDTRPGRGSVVPDRQRRRGSDVGSCRGRTGRRAARTASSMASGSGRTSSRARRRPRCPPATKGGRRLGDARCDGLRRGRGPGPVVTP